MTSLTSKQVVPRASAIFELPEDREVEVGILAGHSDICRFDGHTQRDLDNFRSVWNVLEDEYDRALRNSELALSQQEDVLQARLQNLRVPSGAVAAEEVWLQNIQLSIDEIASLPLRKLTNCLLDNLKGMLPLCADVEDLTPSEVPPRVLPRSISSPITRESEWRKARH